MLPPAVQAYTLLQVKELQTVAGPSLLQPQDLNYINPFNCKGHAAILTSSELDVITCET